MFRLFSRVSTGLQPIGNIVRKHITDVGLALVKRQGDNSEADLMPYVQVRTPFRLIVSMWVDLCGG